MIQLNRFAEVEACKKDIKQFAFLISKKLNLSNANKLTSIAKGILFLKRLYYKSNENDYYINCMISDLFVLLHSMTQDSIKLFYVSYRSLIENFIRVILEYDDNNSTGIRKMFQEAKAKYLDVDFFTYIEGEYGKCCDVVHSNISADIPLYSYYDDLCTSDELSEEKIISLLDQLVTFFNKLKEFTVNNQNSLVDSSFYNQREVLFYLLGSKLYEIFDNNYKTDV